MPANRLIRKATRQQLAERLGAVLDASLDAIVTMDAAGLVAGWNPAAEALFGWSASEADGRPMDELIIPPSSRAAHRAGLGRLLRTGEARLLGRRVEVVACRKDGSTIDVELTLSRVGSEEDDTLFIAHIRDISERRKAEREQESRAAGLEQTAQAGAVKLAAVAAELERSEAMRAESEQLFRLAFRSSPVSLTVISLRTGRLVEVNETFLRWTGFTRAEAIGRTTGELEMWADPADRDAFLRDIDVHGFIRNRECRLRRPDGGTNTFLVSAERIEIRGEPHVFSAGLDIEALKQAEAGLRVALGREQELRRLKSRFVSLVSHEYRTPLGVIRSAAEILEAYFDRLAPARRLLHLGDIKDAAETMTRLMDEVLFLERSESGKLACRRAPLDLVAFIRDIAKAHGHAGHAARIRPDLAADLPEATVDAGLLRLALDNLVGNALKYSPSERPVVVRLRREDDSAVVTVEDQGIGIPADDLPHLTEPFHRARNVGETPGSGLGLVVVKKCADLHGGALAVDSEEGRGTIITLRLPVFLPVP